MKFGKSLMRVVETSDPEWGPYWINYKFLKRKINDIVEAKGGLKVVDQTVVRDPSEISKLSCEVEFFRLLRSELKKSSDFFASTEAVYRIRKERIWAAFKLLEDADIIQDKNTWTRLLMACVKFYKDVLLIENFAIMNYCGFSKILKKHDKMTGFVTREAFMRNVMNHQNFTHYPYIMELIKEAEVLFGNIQQMESVMPLQDEERLFIAAMRDLNHQASRMQAEEKTSAAIDNDSSPSHMPHFFSSLTSTTASLDSSVEGSAPLTAPKEKHKDDRDKEKVRAVRPPSGPDVIAAATASMVGAALRLSQACPPGPHSHACGSTNITSTTTNITTTKTTTTNITVGMRTATAASTPPKEKTSMSTNYSSAEDSLSDGEHHPQRAPKRSAIDAGLL